MAPFRSSRSTRNYDPNNAAPRIRGGAIDHDPTEGLPVQQYTLDAVAIKQDTDSVETDETIQQDQSGAGYPWPELPLPAFYNQLPQHSQELLRRARAGSRRTQISTYDKKTGSYNTPNAAAATSTKNGAHKLKHVNTNAIATNGDSPTPAIPDDDENENDDNDDDPDTTTKAKVIEERTFTANKWTAIPFTVADKLEERRYLAARRQGMGSLYGRSGYTVSGIPSSSDVAAGVNTIGVGAGVDLGDGSGLGNAGGVLGAGTPTRPGRSMPPKRKKRLGGPGRKKRDLGAGVAAVPAVDGAAAGEGGGGVREGVGSGGVGEGAKEDEDENESSSEEGSEEGEIEEGQEENMEEKVGALVPVAEVEAKVEAEAGAEAEAPVVVVPAETKDEDDAPVEEVDLLGSLDAAVDKDMKDAGEANVEAPEATAE